MERRVIKPWMNTQAEIAANPGGSPAQEQKVPVPTVINDPVHGTIPLHPLAVKIINTPQFQRLRHIHQLGGQHYVYPSAAYSRFEHSIGVYHLAGKLVNKLKDQQPELGITSSDALCVQLAGLTHDLGHGPFSHLFEQQVVAGLGLKWEHEKGSVEMLDLITETINFNKKDWEFIKSLIICEPNEEATGRGKDKKFLYEIVANGRNGIDVDKWDYLTRDSYHLGIKCGFDYTRLLHNMRVAKVKMKKNGKGGEEGEELQICVRDKEAGAINSMFHTRFELYEKAYQHKVVQAAELMIAEALVKASKHLTFGGKTMKDCLDDMKAYTDLHDGIFFEILKSKKSDKEDLREASELLERLQRRDLWKFIGQAEMDEKEDVKAMKSSIEDDLKKYRAPVVIAKASRTLGQKGQDPLDKLRFYSKMEPDIGRELSKHQRQITWPTAFKQTWLRAYYTRPEDPQPKDTRPGDTVVVEAFKKQGLSFIKADLKNKSTAELQATATAKPQATATAEPQGTTTAEPQGTATAKPQATATAEPQATATAEPQGTTTADLQSTATTEPQGTATAEPQGTATAEPQGTATAEPQGTATAEPQGTATAEPQGTATADRDTPGSK